MKNVGNKYILEKLSEKERARKAAARMEEFPQSIQAPSSMHPGTTYPVRANLTLRYNPSIGFLCLCGLGGGDTHDIAEPTYKTFNLPTRLSTYLLDINPTAYKTFNLPTRQNPTVTRLSTYLPDINPTAN